MTLLLALSATAWAQSSSKPAPQTAKPKPAKVEPSADEKTEAEPKKPIRDSALYVAEVEFRAGSEAREAAVGRALQSVVVKLTGSRDARLSNVVRKAMSNASSLATEVDVKQDNDMVNGVPVYRQMLTARFDPVAVDTLIAAAGLKYWTGERPKPILWLTIDDGRGPRLVTAQQLAVVRPLANAGLERGMRFLLPAGNPIELAAVGSIGALNTSALQPLTSRYGNDTMLVGKVYRNAGAWSADWVLVRAGVSLASWNFSDLDHRRVIASGADGAADAVAKADARYLPYGAAGKHLFVVEGVDDAEDYLRLMGYLQGMPLVRGIEVLSAEPSSLRLMLDMSVGPRGFALLTQGNPVFTEDDGKTSPPSTEDAKATRLRLN